MKRFITILLIMLIKSCASQSSSISLSIEPSSTSEMPSLLASSSSATPNLSSTFAASAQSSLNTLTSTNGMSMTTATTAASAAATTTTTSAAATTTTSATTTTETARSTTTTISSFSTFPATTTTTVTTPKTAISSSLLSTSITNSSPGGGSPTVSPSLSMSQQSSSSVAPTQPNPALTYQTCQQNDVYCKNSGECYINGQNKRICVCTGDYYGAKCENEANALYKPLVYAFGGSTGFLLLVICIALIITCRKSSRSSASKDLDSFNNVKLRATMNDGMIMEE